jgi:hypothetical protein
MEISDVVMASALALVHVTNLDKPGRREAGIGWSNTKNQAQKNCSAHCNKWINKVLMQSR